MMKTIGVLGGMGPEATNQFCTWITALTPARYDQEHVPVLCFNNSQIPDRTGSILEGGPSPVAELVRTALVLQRAGADFLVMPCNTAHHYHAAIQRELEIPLLHMPELAAAQARMTCPQARRIGLLSTSGTLRMGLYERPLEEQGFSLVLPAEDEQRERVMTAVSAIKRGEKQAARELLLAAAAGLVARGAELILAGCTEIPLVLAQEDLVVPLIDPAEVLARVAIARAGAIPVTALDSAET